MAESGLRGSLSPRVHNTLSYSGALLSLPTVWTLYNLPGKAWLPVLLWCLHFARRTLESIWVHRYGGRRIGPLDYAVEYAYYWGFGVWIGVAVSASGWSFSPLVGVPALALFAIGELGNAHAHWALRGLRRRAGETQREIPQGGLFRWVSCPHYLFEIISWFGFALLCQVLAAWLFFALGSLILAVYAQKRHRQYRLDFDGRAGRSLYPATRRALLPCLF